MQFSADACADVVEVGNLYGSGMGCHGNILLKINGGQERQKLWEEGVGEAETECLILWLVVLELLVGGWWWLPDDLSNMFTLST